MSRWAVDFTLTPASADRSCFGYTAAAADPAPTVTVVTPYYNTGDVFLETAESVRRQSLQQWEWLIVNDGSDLPQALSVLEPFRAGDPRIRVVDLPQNRGLPAARNAGLAQATAPYVFFLDSDDLIEPTTLEKLAWHLESYPEFGFCKGYTIWFGAQHNVNTSSFSAGARFLERNQVTISAMIRTSVARAAGGFDESLRTGLEDWDFWLRCASMGHWGHTVPEPLDWFRRRPEHSDRWEAWTERGVRTMRSELRKRYPHLYKGHFPSTGPRPGVPFAPLCDEPPFTNPLTSSGKRLLLVIPWMAMGGADRFNLDLIEQLQQRRFQVSVACTLAENHPWYAEFARLTSDLFILPTFLRPADYPRFLTYLVHSRQCDTVLVSNSEIGYRLLPYLRTRCPRTTLADFCHMEEEHWNSGGYPRQAVAYQDVLDLNLVSSEHLKRWMVERGGHAGQIEVCYTNVDGERLSPDAALGAQVRQELGIAPDLPLLLYAGRLCAQKRPALFASVMGELRDRGLDFACLVAGDGEERRNLASSLRRLRLGGRVRMLGAVAPARLRRLLAATDLLFLPSEMEGIALTVFEAMAMGVVPVSADVGGQSELVTPECGVLIPRGDPASEVIAYADAIERLLRAPDVRQTMARAARRRVVEHFPIERMGDRVVTLLERAAQAHAEADGRAAPLAKRLATEYALQALEHDGLVQAANRVWKYHRLETVRARGSALLGILRARWRGVLRHLGWLAWTITAVRKVKDALWIAGHRIKVRLKPT